MQETIEIYDKSKVFLSEIKPHLDKITSVCGAEGIPFMFAAAIKSTENDTFYERAGELPKMAGTNLAKDYLTPASIALAGGRIVAGDIRAELSEAIANFDIPEDDDEFEEVPTATVPVKRAETNVVVRPEPKVEEKIVKAEETKAEKPANNEDMVFDGFDNIF